jgi:hypothetical protein
MSESPYTEPILDLLSDQVERTVVEIMEGIGARDGAGIHQRIRELMWRLAENRDPRKLEAGRRGRQVTYVIVSRDPRNPVEATEL